MPPRSKFYVLTSTFLPRPYRPAPAPVQTFVFPSAPQQFLNFFPVPSGHAAFRSNCGPECLIGNVRSTADAFASAGASVPGLPAAGGRFIPEPLVS